MTEETKQKIQKIAQTYGYDAQSRQCIEEMAELTQDINKYYRTRAMEYDNKYPFYPPDNYLPKEFTSYNNLIEKMADVQIMLWQLEYLLNADTSIIIQQKLDRQLERIESE